MTSNAQKVLELLKPLKLSELFEIIKILETEYGVKISVRINGDGKEDLRKYVKQQASHGDSLAAQSVYITALEHALKQLQAQNGAMRDTLKNLIDRIDDADYHNPADVEAYKYISRQFADSQAKVNMLVGVLEMAKEALEYCCEAIDQIRTYVIAKDDELTPDAQQLKEAEKIYKLCWGKATVACDDEGKCMLQDDECPIMCTKYKTLAAIEKAGGCID